MEITDGNRGMLEYQSNISKNLIIKGLDTQDQVSKYVCLIIKSLDTQDPPKSLILTLVN